MNAESSNTAVIWYKAIEKSSQPCGREEKNYKNKTKDIAITRKHYEKFIFNSLHFHVWLLSDFFCLIVIWNCALEDTTAASPLNLESVAEQLYSASEQWT